VAFQGFYIKANQGPAKPRHHLLDAHYINPAIDGQSITCAYFGSFDTCMLYKTYNQSPIWRDGVSYQRIVNFSSLLHFFSRSLQETWRSFLATMCSLQVLRQGGLRYRNEPTKSAFLRPAPAGYANLFEGRLHRISSNHRYCDCYSTRRQIPQRSPPRDRRRIPHTGAMLLARCVGLCLADERSYISPDGNGVGYERDRA